MPSLRISETRMISDSSPHQAWRTGGFDEWAVSWLPARPLTRNEAITAMHIAEIVVTWKRLEKAKQHPQVQTEKFAAELGLPGDEAALHVTMHPGLCLHEGNPGDLDTRCDERPRKGSRYCPEHA